MDVVKCGSCAVHLNGVDAIQTGIVSCKHNLYCHSCNASWRNCPQCSSRTLAQTRCLWCDYQQDICDDCKQGFDKGVRTMGKNLCIVCSDKEAAKTKPSKRLIERTFLAPCLVCKGVCTCAH